MKIKKVKIPIFNHKLNVFEVTNKRDTDKLVKELKSLKIINKDDEQEIRDNIENECDGACTFYRKADCTLVVVIYIQSNQDRRREVLAHEKRHIEDHILKHLGIDDMESAAYLAGYLARDSRGALTLFSQEPRRKEYIYNKGTSYEIRISGWTSDDYEKCGIGTMAISSKLYPEVTYENSPKKVTFKID